MVPDGAQPTRAQAGPSGSMTVQMRVNDMMTEDAPVRENGRSASLAKGPGGGGGGGGGCTITRSTNIDFGVQVVQPGNRLPQLIGGAFMTMVCNPNTFRNAAGTTAPVEVSVFHGAAAAAPPLYMTQGGLPASTGVEYQLCEDNGCKSPFTGNSGTVGAMLIDRGRVYIAGDISGPSTILGTPVAVASARAASSPVLIELAVP